MAPAWQFDISSFMVLLGEQEETNYRSMQRSYPECFIAAPVAGLQSYLRSFTSIVNIKGPEFIHPRWKGKKQLRNIRLARSIDLFGLLRDGKYSVYEINPKDHGEKSKAKSIQLWAWVVASWVLFGILLLVVFLHDRFTWIGLSNCFALTAWSITIRLIDHYCIQVAKHDESSNPNKEDAVVILGRRNSCFILRGFRKDVARWTDWDLHHDKKAHHQILDAFVRIGTLSLMLFIFTTLPNGSTLDQVAFVCQNVLAQINVLLGQRLNSQQCLASLKIVEYMGKCRSRTHIYHSLIRQFGDGPWIDAVGLLPKMGTWDRWRSRVMESKIDPKDLYDECLKAEEIEELVCHPKIG